ncbi:CsbD family protein [Algiphilus sp.]|uniref:CsbD family protein n=1 Tax=Algiphilus sp. TaxID=1872431 RepID=UPI0025C6F148|nr:CsbD family protein [Algiphilus sp.]MCK5771529.1 CsbD family protein [Algiphilus sp.]
MNRDQLEGKRDELVARLKQEWAELTDDEIRLAESNVDELKAKIQQKYGETREAVSEKFNRIVEGVKNNDAA